MTLEERINELEARIAALEQRPGFLARVKASAAVALAAAWANKWTVLPYLLLAVVLASGTAPTFKGCDWHWPTPTPTPIPQPDPPKPPPIPAAGLRVLIVYETADKLPRDQHLILTSTTLRTYLEQKCATGDDGRTKEYRFFDKDVSPANESKVWQDAMARKRDTLPWIVVSDGQTGFEGPLPANVDETLALLRKYGG